MTTIKLLDARRGLFRKCEELFKDAKIAKSIYCYLCDGIDDCEDVTPHREKGKWTLNRDGNWACSLCGFDPYHDNMKGMNFCPNCGADMRERSEYDKRSTEKGI